MIVDMNTIGSIWPESVLAVLAVWMIVYGAFQPVRWWWIIFSLMSYALVGSIIWRYELPGFLTGTHGIQWTGPIAVDDLGFVLRVLALLVGTLFTLISARAIQAHLASEFLGTLMLLIAGVMLVSRANDLVFLFVSLELISIPTYVLLYLGRRDRTTSEATAKYFFLSILSSAILLYGMSFLYGLAGTTTLTAPSGQLSIANALAVQSADNTVAALAPVALVLIVAGLGFKIAAVPFHFYAPDVYQGATNGNAGLLAIAPKIGGLAALIRLLVVAMPNTSELTWQLLLVVSIASMTLGNVCALWQNNIRRLMAYSSIAHAGYMLIGVVVALVAGGEIQGNGVGAATFYVIVYTLASAGMFAALAYLGGIQHEVNGVEDLAGLGKTQPVAGAVIAVCMLSLAGIPPLAGFWGKLNLFWGAVQAASLSSSGTWLIVLAIAGAINAAIAAAYYLRIVSVMYFGVSRTEFGGDGGWGPRAAMIAAAVLVVGVGLFPGGIWDATSRADASLRRPAVRPVRTSIATNDEPPGDER